jgi:hypothetical protein
MLVAPGARSKTTWLALQFVTAQPYIMDGCVGYFDRQDWQPVMLVPADGANLRVANWLARLSPKHLDGYIAGKAAHPNADVRLLTPRRLSRAADYFSLGDPRSEFCALLVREQPPSSVPIVCGSYG